MAEFGVKATTLQAPSGNMPVIDPVRQPASPAFDLSGAQGWMAGIGKTKDEKPWMVMRNDYQRQLGGIEEARLTGEIDDRTALTRSRQLTTQFQVKGADFGEEYSKSIANTYTHVRTGTGIEEVEQIRKKEVDNLDTFNKTLIDQGIAIVPLGQQTSEQRASTTALYTAIKKVEHTQKQADENYKRDITMEKDSRERGVATFQFEQRRMQVDAQNALSDVKTSTLNLLDTNYKTFQQAVADGKMTLEQARQALKTNFGSVRSSATNLLQGDPAALADYNKNMEYMEGIYTDALDPAKSSQGLTDEINRIVQAKQLEMLKGIPNTVTLAAMGKLLPNTDMGKFAATSVAMDALFSDFKNISTTKTIPSIGANDTKTQRETFGAISKTMNQGVAKTSRDPVGDINAAAEGVDAMLKSVGKLDGSDNASLAYVGDFLASDTMKQYITQGKYNPELASKALDVFSQTALNSFSQTIGKTITAQVGEATYTDGRRDTGKTPSLLNLIKFEMDDSGKFTAKMAKDPSATFVASEAYMRTLVRDAQKQADDLSKFVRAGAHLGGSTDYKQFWEQQGHLFFPPNTFPTPDQRKALMAQGWDGVGFPYNKSSWTKRPGTKE